MVAALMLGLGAAIVTVTIAAEVTAIGGNDVAWEGVGAVEIAKSGLLQEAMLLQGLAFGLVILTPRVRSRPSSCFPRLSALWSRCGRRSLTSGRGSISTQRRASSLSQGP
jgi:hypothetical protein